MSRPPRIALGIAVAIAAWPLLAPLGVTEVGGFRMFTRVEHARLVILAIDGEERRAVDGAELAPHLGQDARRVVGQATSGTIGEASIDSLDASLGAIAALACEIVRPERVEITLARSSLGGEPLGTRTEVVACAR